MKADAKSLSRGATLATQCVSCHGPKGDGEAERAIPAVRGQNPVYLQAQMGLFAGDKRKLDDAGPDENKKRVFKGLSESDLADLAVYYATLKQRSIFFARRAAMQRRRFDICPYRQFQ